MPTASLILGVLLLAIILACYFFFRSGRFLDYREEKLPGLLAGEKNFSENIFRYLDRTDAAVLCRALAEASQKISAELWQEIGRRLESLGRDREFIALLYHEDVEARSSAAEVLGYLRFPGASRALLEALADKNDAVRMAASRALAEIKDPELAASLVAFLKQPDRWLPARVAEVLVALGEHAVEPLLKAIPHFEGEAHLIAEILGEIGDSRAVPHLIELLGKSPRARVRAAAAEALGKINSAEAIPALKKALRDEAWEVRSRAVNALARTGNPRVIPLLEEALKDAEWNVRASAEAAIGEMAAAVERL